ncbi:RNA-binding protein [Gordonia phage William]|uniref:DUF3850 domain-containing protein n=1 Tax=Gordonia phage William TaxID=2571253 RepID=A0A4Y6EEN5_9CAUD|nr:RNA-binding protein [Gordonia phage William]QDF17163.1 hypothetical protein SEA_WILLIAM_68 [Gordonia phage William]
MSGRISREELIELCSDGVVPQGKWRNRDSAAAQIQLGKARALLAAGCEFYVFSDKIATDDRTIWVEITWFGFSHFEYGGNATDDDTFYIPTRTRLNEVNGDGLVLTMIHELKIDKRWYYHVRDLTKNVEVRIHDRDYQVGDTLRMIVPGQEWLRVERQITHVLVSSPAVDGLMPGYVALSLDDGGKLADAEERARKAERSNAPLRGTITRLTREVRELGGVV